jgi:hypothetical protein
MLRSKPADDFEVEYHLTPTGWIRGCEWFLGEMQAETPAPPDRLLTMKKRLYQQSPTAEKDVRWTTTWRDPGVQESDLDLLQTRFRLPEA